jgi:ATP-dependent Clp protease adaptor protein ClpS
VSTAPVVEPEVIPGVAEETALPWITLVWNDPVNLMSYVTYVFQTYFGYSRSKAEMERDCMAMQGYGLWSTFEKDQ